MNNHARVADRATIAVLIVAFGILGALGIQRKLFAKRAVVPSPRSAQYLSDWRALAREGVTLGRIESPLAVVSHEQDGALIVRYDSLAFQRVDQYALSTVPIAVAAGAGGRLEYDLTHVSRASFLSDGRIAAFASQESRMFIFLTDGRGQRTFGGVGQAPGQFARADFTVLKGDTLAFVDAGIRRVTWMAADAKVIATKPINGVLPNYGGQMSGALPGGRFVLNSSGIVAETPDSGKQINASVNVLSANGDAREILKVPDVQVATMQTHFRSTSGRGPPRVSVLFRFASPARVVVWDTLIAIASADRYNVARYNSAGRLQSVINVATPRRPVTEAMRTAEISMRIARLREPRMEPVRNLVEAERIERAIPFSDSLPPYADVLVASDGTLWVVDAVAPGDTSWSATAFKRDGTISKRLHSVVRGTPLAFGNDRVLIKRADSDGIISLEVYQIRPAQRRVR